MTMEYEFPAKFDIIIVGTGIVESILSAAASRIGKQVLHIDENEYYGGQWSSFNLEAILKLKDNTTLEKDNSCISEESNLYHFGNNIYDIKDIEYKFHVLSNVTNEDVIDEGKEVENNPSDEIWSEDSLLKVSRKFNIDLVPKLQYARGDFVELLISSNIARYSEYRSVSRILTWYNNNLEFLPCSRSDVFANTKVSVVEKRILMKLFTSVNSEETENYENKTFKQFLTDKKLTPNLIHYVLYGISMSSEDTPCEKGIQRVKRFLNSLGRFGKMPFLFSMYGSGEIPQAFCRLSAVFGGVFALAQSLQGFNVSENKFKSIKIRDKKIEAENLVMGIKNVPKQFLRSNKIEYISRCVLITQQSILKSEKEHLTLMFYPPENGKPFVTLIELGSLTGTCPKNLFLVHLIAKQVNSPKEDFSTLIENLFTQNRENLSEKENKKPLILWSMYFSIPNSNNVELVEGLPGNSFVCPGPDTDLDYDFSVHVAKKMFEEIYPEADFLPRAPDPEEIVIGDYDNEETSETEHKVD
ncbi:rab proteins geranylgeranyltransferase component A 1 [Diorhabda sublineata]|uniref:rab proteins geranylgeranyltransferase component A 1 n=1 Tax=Diorhabda sublineata TaxID=1163346 RepID=UPI0024E127C0|nr:rab proteins geranylgeranyltransferase component A 1 [Diorhabda sublineata]